MIGLQRSTVIPGMLLLRCLIWGLLAFLLTAQQASSATLLAQQPGPLYLVTVDGVLTAPSADYLRRSLRQAEAAGATALVIELRSEGGVLRILRRLARELHDAEVPVVVYVSPSGTQSGASGALLLSGAHLAAMAPNTSFGTPYPLAQLDNLLSQDTRELLLDDLSQQLRDWNGERGRGTDWIDQGVREGIILNNEQAAAATPPAIDLVAPTLETLPQLLEGRVVRLANGNEMQLSALGRPFEAIEPTIWERLRLLLADPNVAFLLFVLGGIAIYCELANPGTSIFAGIGIVLLAAAIFGGLLVLPARPLSVAGLILSFILIGADLFTPSHGGLTIAGLAVLIVSALTLIDPLQAPGVGVALWAIVVVALAIGGLTGLGILLAVRAQRRIVTGGSEGLVGQLAEVRRELDPEGMVFVDGALWQAVSQSGPIEKGAWVKVVAVERLRLIVRQLE